MRRLLHILLLILVTTSIHAQSEETNRILSYLLHTPTRLMTLWVFCICSLNRGEGMKDKDGIFAEKSMENEKILSNCMFR